jgi:hypothetical protein
LNSYELAPVFERAFRTPVYTATSPYFSSTSFSSCSSHGTSPLGKCHTLGCVPHEHLDKCCAIFLVVKHRTDLTGNNVLLDCGLLSTLRKWRLQYSDKTLRFGTRLAPSIRAAASCATFLGSLGTPPCPWGLAWCDVSLQSFRLPMQSSKVLTSSILSVMACFFTWVPNPINTRPSLFAHAISPRAIPPPSPTSQLPISHRSATLRGIWNSGGQ